MLVTQGNNRIWRKVKRDSFSAESTKLLIALLSPFSFSLTVFPSPLLFYVFVSFASSCVFLVPVVLGGWQIRPSLTVGTITWDSALGCVI